MVILSLLKELTGLTFTWTSPIGQRMTRTRLQIRRPGQPCLANRAVASRYFWSSLKLLIFFVFFFSLHRLFNSETQSEFHHFSLKVDIKFSKSYLSKISVVINESCSEVSVRKVMGHQFVEKPVKDINNYHTVGHFKSTNAFLNPT